MSLERAKKLTKSNLGWTHTVCCFYIFLLQ